MNEIIGKKVKDTITGFEGIATGCSEYISGCTQVLISPHVKEDGALSDSVWFDLQRVEATEEAAVSLDNSETPGPDMAAPVR